MFVERVISLSVFIFSTGESLNFHLNCSPKIRTKLLIREMTQNANVLDEICIHDCTLFFLLLDSFSTFMQPMYLSPHNCRDSF